jgi:hypothetical protein
MVCGSSLLSFTPLRKEKGKRKTKGKGKKQKNCSSDRSRSKRRRKKKKTLTYRRTNRERQCLPGNAANASQCTAISAIRNERKQHTKRKKRGDNFISSILLACFGLFFLFSFDWVTTYYY